MDNISAEEWGFNPRPSKEATSEKPPKLHIIKSFNPRPRKEATSLRRSNQ